MGAPAVLKRSGKPGAGSDAVGPDGARRGSGERAPARKRSRVEVVAMRNKKRMVKAHRWLSLVVGIWAVLQALSGVVMISGDQIHEWRHPALYHHGSGDEGVGAALAAARAALP